MVSWMILFSARLNGRSILISFNVKNNWLRGSHNCFNLLLFTFESIQLSFFKYLGILKLPFIFSCFFFEILLLKRKKRIACLDFGRDYTRLDASRHRKHCGVLKCSNCNSLFISRRSIIRLNIMLIYLLSSLETHSKRR